MTLDSFIKKIQGYYGADYPAGQLPYIRTYLSDRTERALDFLFAETLKSFSSQYGKCPDISVFDKLRPDICDRLEQEQDLTTPAITADAGNTIDASEIIVEFSEWRKKAGLDVTCQKRAASI